VGSTFLRSTPRYLSSDHNLLYRYHQWRANLRIREFQPIKTVPNVPASHPFTERLIGTIRREYLDQILFWNGHDLEEKLEEFQDYYNTHRVHQSLNLKTPNEAVGKRQPTRAKFSKYSWRSHCNGLFQTPIAA